GIDPGGPFAFRWFGTPAFPRARTTLTSRARARTEPVGMTTPLPYPSTWTAPPAGRVLVLAPHADDETIGCGGAIALHVAQGDPVAIAIATDGMRGDPDGRFAGSDYRELRRSEARAAAGALGAPPPELWDLADQGLL